jgi:hypothetical protein
MPGELDSRVQTRERGATGVWSGWSARPLAARRRRPGRATGGRRTGGPTNSAARRPSPPLAEQQVPPDRSCAAVVVAPSSVRGRFWFPNAPPARRHPGRLLPLRLLHPRLSLARPTWPTRSPLGTLIGFRRPKPSEVALQLHQVALVRGPCPPGTRPAAVLAPPLGLLAGRFVMLALPLGPRTVPKSPDRALTAAHRASSYSPLRPSFHFKPFRRIRARPEFAASRRDPGAPAP